MKKNEIEFNFIVKADYSKKANFYEEHKKKYLMMKMFKN